MPRSRLVPLVLLAVATTAAVGVLSAARMSQERTRIIDAFGADRLNVLEQVNRRIESELDDIAQDLRYVAEMLQRARSNEERSRILQPLLAVVRPYVAARIYDSRSRLLLAAVDPHLDPHFIDPSLDALMSTVGETALGARQGEVTISERDPAARNVRYRAFAIPIRIPREAAALVLLVDMEPIFSALKTVSAMPGTRLLVLGPFGAACPPSDPSFFETIDRTADLPGFGELIRRLKAGGAGTLLIDGVEAEAMGLGRDALIAAYAPVWMQATGLWGVASLASTTVIAAEERATLLRFLLTSGTFGLLLIAFGAYHIITQGRAAELRERAMAAEHLARLVEMTRQIIDSIPVGIAVLSEELRVTDVNSRLEAPATAPGRSPTGSGQGTNSRLEAPKTLESVFPDTQPDVLLRIRDLLVEALATRTRQSLIGQRFALGGAEGCYNLHAVPLHRPHAEARILLVVEDLSSIDTLTRQLLRAEQHATVGVLAAGVAHEVGTPLGIARARAEYLLGQLGQGDPRTRGLEVIVDQIDLVSRTIRQLLDFSRVQQADVRTVALSPVVGSVIELLGIERERRRVELTAEIPPWIPDLAANPDQLQQVLVNLVLNAFDACAPGGRVQIAASQREESRSRDNRVRIEVADDGCGIPAEHRNHVFDPFFTTKKRGQGTGLGLTIAAQIIQNHGGEIEISSEVGAGTRVSILWPAAAPALPVRVHEVGSSHAAATR